MAGMMSDQCHFCKGGVTPSAATQTNNLYGYPVCASEACLNLAREEAAKAADMGQPPEFKVLRDHGWKIESGNGIASKIIGQSECTIKLPELLAGKRGSAVAVAGYAYELELDTERDRELKALFVALEKATTKAKTPEVVKLPSQEVRREPKTAQPVSNKQKLPANPANMQQLALTTKNVISYLNPDLTEEDAVIFIHRCLQYGMNPFKNDCYPIKYDKTKPASFVVSKGWFGKVAEAHPQFDGYKAGIIVRNVECTMERREGTFLIEGEMLLGGWAEIHRKDRKVPFRYECALKDVIQTKREGDRAVPTKFWAREPGHMVMKTCVLRGLRDAFPEKLSGLYEQDEMPEVDA